jgi:large subunit ribosomal protein L6
MSNIGQEKILIASNVKIKTYKNFIVLFGLFGNLKVKCPLSLKIKKESNVLSIQLLSSKKNRIYKKLKMGWGTFRTDLFKSIHGISNNYQLLLNLIGVGFKVFRKTNKLILRLGFSHEVFLKLPFHLFEMKKLQKRPLLFLLTSCDYNLLRNISFFLRSFKKPEIYKGKGFSFKTEILRLKDGKKIKN